MSPHRPTRFFGSDANTAEPSDKWPWPAGADGTVAFRGFRGRYRLSWTGKDGQTETVLADVK